MNKVIILDSDLLCNKVYVVNLPEKDFKDSYELIEYINKTYNIEINDDAIFQYVNNKLEIEVL